MFSLGTPILKKSFLWVHPFWRKVFSWYTHLKNSFLWMHPFWVYIGDQKIVPPNPPTTTRRRRGRRTTLSSPWSVGCAADKTEEEEWSVGFGGCSFSFTKERDHRPTHKKIGVFGDTPCDLFFYYTTVPKKKVQTAYPGKKSVFFFFVTKTRHKMGYKRLVFSIYFIFGELQWLACHHSKTEQQVSTTTI